MSTLRTEQGHLKASGTDAAPGTHAEDLSSAVPNLLGVAFNAATKFFGVTASVVSGIGTVCLAVGFLAERSYLRMAGLSMIPPDVNQYIYTGAMLIGLLPLTLLVAFGFDTLATWRILVAMVAIILATWVVASVARRVIRKSHSLSRSQERVRTLSSPRTPSRWIIGLVVGVCIVVQLVVIIQLSVTANLSGLLFRSYTPAAPIPDLFIWADTSTLADCITTNSKTVLWQHVGWITLGVLLSGILTWQVSRWYSDLSSEPSDGGRRMKGRWANAALIGQAFLMVAELVLLPYNLGALILHHSYYLVRVGLKAEASASNPSLTQPLLLVYHIGDKYCLYSKSNPPQIVQLNDSDITSFAYVGSVDLFDQEGH